MSQPQWEFQQANPRSVRRDPFEAEFFTGEEETEEVYGRTDSLVREAIQNSLDARIDERPAIVRFALSTPETAVRSSEVEPYVLGLPRHMRALKNDVLGGDPPYAPMSWLVVEDFNTKGLIGDPARSSDPTSFPEREAFYWFWRNVGRSGKSGTDRGRWGLGKTVFPATSRINALFGLTVRYDDGRALLMGQAVTRSHDLDIGTYEPEAFFHACEPGSRIQMPSDDPQLISRFISDFRLHRAADTPGLSVVVPYPFTTLKASELLRSVVVHYFVAIMRGHLIVRVEGPDRPECELTGDTIQALAGELQWGGRRAEKKHVMPPFDLVGWALQEQDKGPESLKRAGTSKVPEWSADLFPEGLQERLRADLQAHKPVAVRVPMTVELKRGGLRDCFFDVFVERDNTLQRSEDYFVREGMTIAGISTLGTGSNYRALVLVDDDVLSNLLGDAEGPAHNDWSTGESRPDQTYSKWKRRITFVKQSVAKLISLLSPPPEALDRDLLRDIFWLPNDGDSGESEERGRRGRKPKRNPPPPPPPPPPQPKRYSVQAIDGGFKVGAGEGDFPQRLIIRAAYDVPDGSPLRRWSRYDFEFGRAPIDVVVTGGRLEVQEGNRLEFVPGDSDFEVRATGFESVRDVYVDVRAVEQEEEEDVIRRFNFTGRKKLPHSIFDIRLESGSPRQFTASFDLTDYAFPADAKLYFEAYASGSGVVARFPWGTAATPAPHEDRSLDELPGENVNFTFKVVDEAEATGKILGVASGISLNRAAAGEGERRRSLLPVNPLPLGQQVWRVTFMEDGPWLDVNNEIPDIMSRAQSDPLFISLVYPAVVRQVLTEALVIGDNYDPEATDRWEGRWVSFGQRFHPEVTPPPEADDADARRDWVEQVVSGFAAYYTAKDRFAGVPYAGLEPSV